jgi:uncharacterized protein YbaR (Trm112 family)
LITAEFLAMIRCPENRSKLALADSALVDRLNAAIRAGRLKNRAGQAVAEPIDAALVREDQQVAYPIMDDIPILLVDEGMMMDQLAS